MEKLELKVELRDKVGKTLSQHLRTIGKLPAVVYGRGMAPVHIGVEAKNFLKLISGHAGRNAIIQMQIDRDGKEEELPVMVKDLQRDPVTDVIQHIDFLRIELKEEVRTRVPVELSGEAIGVREDGGILIYGLREVEIRCLPMNIPDIFTADVSALRIGDSLHVSDLKVSEGVTLLTPSGESIASVAPPAKEEVVEAPAVPAAEVPATEVSAEAAASVGEQPPEKPEESPKEKGKEKK